MLHRIRYSVTFATTGRTLAEDITFRPGFGILTGATETGKSFAVEMVRWCLFGSAALRGKISDYKKATARLAITIKGETYNIERTANTATLFRGEDQIAVGTTTVNRKVTELFGFGLEVFDASCVALQGEIEALGMMKPAERKRLVDSVIGMGVIEELGKSAGDEANALKRRAKDLSENLREPEPPVKPSAYRSLAEIDVELAELGKARARLDHLRGITAETRARPVPPEETVTIPARELQNLAQQQDTVKARLKTAEMELTALPQPSPHTEDDLTGIEAEIAAYQRWEEKRQLLAATPDPGVSTDSVRQALAFLEAQHLRTRIADLRSKGAHTCPSCKFEWPVEATTIADLEATLEPLKDFRHPDDLPTERGALAALLRAAEAWDELQPRLAELADVDPCDRPKLSAADIESYRNRNQYADRRTELTGEVEVLRSDLLDQPDYAAQLRERQRYEDRLAIHQDQLAEFENWETAYAAAKVEIETFVASVKGYEALSELRSAVMIHDTLRARFEVDLKGYTDGMTAVSETLDEAGDWDRARTALTNLRGMVKQHLMPSLNRVSSQYLAQMTGGERQVIHADEDFAISVDGQPLNSLSGSGKAVACLALRLGLGQVLTHGVFPVFIGDEIDASMDQNRTANTAAMLEALKSRLGQILLVTHKRPEADYVIELGGG